MSEFEFDPDRALQAVLSAAVNCAAADINPMGRSPTVASTLLAQAWFAQIQREYEQAFSRTPELSREMAAARRLAGDGADDVVASHGGMVPIHRVNNQDIPCPGHMLIGCVPLWVHYVREVQRVVAILREVDSV